MLGTSLCPESAMSLKQAKKIITPIDKELVKELKAGDWLLLNGWVYTARDRAHKLIFELLEQKKALPFPLENQLIYYTGPSPAKPGEIIGSAGPTTSSRMDKYTPKLYELGLSATLGKGERSSEIIEAVKKFIGLYLVTIGGAGAYLSERIKQARVVAWEELGPEAVYQLYLEDFPCLVAYDSQGRDYFSEQRKKYQKE